MNNETTTLIQRESHLWEAANILRGPVDAADFKTSTKGLKEGATAAFAELERLIAILKREGLLS